MPKDKEPTKQLSLTDDQTPLFDCPCGVDFMKNIRFAIRRAQKPLVLRAMKFSILALSSFTRVSNLFKCGMCKDNNIFFFSCPIVTNELNSLIFISISTECLRPFFLRYYRQVWVISLFFNRCLSAVIKNAKLMYGKKISQITWEIGELKINW